uniref:Uncharacterized protein n=1 Tax=Rhipicephalus microplus TaxID=6941 RepID=A0A6G5A125_RHIMP
MHVFLAQSATFPFVMAWRHSSLHEMNAAYCQRAIWGRRFQSNGTDALLSIAFRFSENKYSCRCALTIRYEKVGWASTVIHSCRFKRSTRFARQSMPVLSLCRSCHVCVVARFPHVSIL